MEKKPLKIKVEIAQYPYRINVYSEREEEVVRAAAKSINERIDKLRKLYGADEMKYVSMAALQEAVERINGEQMLGRRIDIIAVENMNNSVQQCLRGLNVEASKIGNIKDETEND